MVNSISQRLGNAAKAAGLVAILTGTSGCVAPGQRSGTNAPNMPYIVQPGYSQWNLGVGFLNLSNSAGAISSSSASAPDPAEQKMYIVYSTERKRYLLPKERGPPVCLPHENANGRWFLPAADDRNYIWIPKE